VLAVGEEQGGPLIELFDYRADAIGEIDKRSVVGLGIFAGLLKLRSEALDGGSEPGSVIGIERNGFAIDIDGFVFNLRIELAVNCRRDPRKLRETEVVGSKLL